MNFPPQVERWRPLVAKYFPPNLVDKALWVIMYESGGRPDAVGDGGNAIGLFQIHHAGSIQGRPPKEALFDPEANIRFAALNLGAAYGNWKPWGENNLYKGKPFGALGFHPFPGTTGAGGQRPAPTAPLRVRFANQPAPEQAPVNGRAATTEDIVFDRGTWIPLQSTEKDSKPTPTPTPTPTTTPTRTPSSTPTPSATPWLPRTPTPTPSATPTPAPSSSSSSSGSPGFGARFWDTVLWLTGKDQPKPPPPTPTRPMPQNMAEMASELAYLRGQLNPYIAKIGIYAPAGWNPTEFTVDEDGVLVAQPLLPPNMRVLDTRAAPSGPGVYVFENGKVKAKVMSMDEYYQAIDLHTRLVNITSVSSTLNDPERLAEMIEFANAIWQMSPEYQAYLDAVDAAQRETGILESAAQMADLEVLGWRNNQKTAHDQQVNNAAALINRGVALGEQIHQPWVQPNREERINYWRSRFDEMMPRAPSRPAAPWASMFQGYNPFKIPTVPGYHDPNESEADHPYYSYGGVW